LSKDYPIFGASLEVKTLTPSGVAFKVAGNKDSKSNLINGDLEAKYTDKVHGLTVTQAWTTSNVLRNTVELENQLAKGLKLDLATSLNPEKGAKTAVLGGIFKQSGVHTRATLDVFKVSSNSSCRPPCCDLDDDDGYEPQGPTFTADTVLGRDGFLAGAEASYNVTEGKVTRYAAALGYNAPEYAVTLHGLNSLNTFSASYYHRINRDVEAGAKAIYDPKTNGGVALEVGSKVYLDASAFVKAKINNAGVVALGYTQALRPGVKASFGLALDTQKLNDANPIGPSHKVGVNFVFDS
jgi:voltage-dependent anion channel protein 2